MLLSSDHLKEGTSSPTPFNPSTLFGKQGKGVSFDFNDLSTLFQDHKGTTPVTAYGQPVGLVLDKSHDLLVSQEVITNSGNPFVNPFHWGAVNTKLSIDADTLLIESTSNVHEGYAYTTGATSDCWVTISFYVEASSSPGYISVCGKQLTFEGVGLKSFITYIPLNTLNNRVQIGFQSPSIGNKLSLKYVSVKELKGNHVFQEASSKRPILGCQPVKGIRNLLSYSHDFSNNLWGLPQGKLTKDIASSGLKTAINFSGVSTSLSRTLSPVKKAGLYTYTVCLKSEASSVLTLRVSNQTQNIDYQSGVLNPTKGTIEGLGWSCISKPNGFYECSFTTGEVNIEDVLVLYYGATESTSASFVVTLDYAQLELGSSKTNIQEVESFFNIKEEGVSSVNYLKFDGVDDYLTSLPFDLSLNGELTMVTSFHINTTKQEVIAAYGEDYLPINAFSLVSYSPTIVFTFGGSSSSSVGSVWPTDDDISFFVGQASIDNSLLLNELNGKISKSDNELGEGTRFDKKAISLGFSHMCFSGKLYSMTIIDKLLPEETLRDLKEYSWRELGPNSFTPRDLFYPYTKGIWYEPNDLSTMYTSLSSFDPLVSPVTATEQPVGMITNKCVSTFDASSYLDDPKLTGLSSQLGERMFNLKADADDVTDFHGVSFKLPSGVYEFDLDILRIGAESNLRVDIGLTLNKVYPVTGPQNLKITVAIDRPDSRIFFLRELTKSMDMDIQFNSIRCITQLHAYQLTSSKRPLLKRNKVTGYNYLSFDGVDDFLFTGLFDLKHTKDLSIFAVVKKRENSQKNVVLSHGSTPTTTEGGFVLYTPAESESLALTVNSTTNITTTLLNSSSSQDNVFTGTSLLGTGEVILQDLQASSKMIGTASNLTYGEQPLYIGMQTDPFQGDIYSLIVVDRKVSERERYATEEYLRNQIKDPTIDVVTLFKDGEQGVYFDFNDTSTLYSDTLGLKPAVVNRQSLGLVLDKSMKNAVNLPFNVGILPGYFNTGSTDDYLKIIGAERSRTTEWFGVKPNMTYRFLTEYSDCARIQFQNIDGDISYYNESTDSSATNMLVTTAEDTVFMRVYFASQALLDDAKEFAVQVIPGNHARQVITNQQPEIIRDSKTGIYTVKFDGVNTHLKTSSLDLSHTDKITVVLAFKKETETNNSACLVSFGHVDQTGSFILSTPQVISTSSLDLEYNLGNEDKGSVSVTIDDRMVVSGSLDTSAEVSLKAGENILKKSVTKGTNLGNYQLLLGSNNKFTSMFNGEISSLLIIDRLLNEEELQLVESSFNRYLVPNSFDLKQKVRSGFYFEPNDLSSMFQDAEGTVPVTEEGQPVGCIIDQIKGIRAIQESSSKRPVLRRNPSTKAYYLSFDGFDDFLYIESFSSYSSFFSLCASFESYNRDTDASIVELGLNSESELGLGLSLSKDKVFKFSGFFGDTTATNVTVPYPALGSLSEVLFGNVRLSSYLKPKTFYVGQGSITVDDHANKSVYYFATLPFYIGRRGGTSLPFAGNIYGLIGATRNFARNDIREIQEQFRSRMTPFFKLSDIFKEDSDGFLYDINDLSTLYQDKEGTTPAVVGKPVGLILDKHARDASGHNAYQMTEKSKPILRYNSYTNSYYLEFDGVASQLTTNTFNWNNDTVNLFAAVTRKGLTSSGLVAEFADSSLKADSFTLFAPYSNGIPNYSFKSGGRQVVVPWDGDYSSNILCATGKLKENMTKLVVDNTAEKDSYSFQDADTFGAYPLAIGKRGASTFPFKGDLYALIGSNFETTSLVTQRIHEELEHRIKIPETIEDSLLKSSTKFFYDIDDLSTLYQNTNLTSPAEVDKPVGLILDKSQRFEKRDLVQNGAFTGNLTEWVATASTISVNNGYVLITNTSKSEGYLRQNLTITSGKLYKVTYDLHSASNTSGGAISLGGVRTTTGVESGKKTFYVIALSDSPLEIRTNTTTEGAYVSLSNISVQEIKGNHAYQTTSAARPILRQNTLTGKHYLEFDGIDDFLQTPSIEWGSAEATLFASLYRESTSAAKTFLEFSENSQTNADSFSVSLPAALNSNHLVTTFKGAKSFSTLSTSYPEEGPVMFTTILRTLEEPSILRVNGQLVSTLKVGVYDRNHYGTYPLYIGRRGGTEQPFKGHLYALTGLNRSAHESEINLIEENFQSRIGTPETFEEALLVNQKATKFFYNIDNLETMYQDAIGQTPATVGNPVGLVLDLGQQLQQGENLSQVKSIPLGEIGGSEYKNTPLCSIDIGKWYSVTLTVSDYQGTGDVGLYGAFSNIAYPDKASGDKKISFLGLAKNSTLTFFTRSTNTCSVSDIVVKELRGNHAYQSTSAMRPILRYDSQIEKHYLEFDGIDDFLQTGTISWGTDKLSLLAGITKLNDDAPAIVCEFSSNASVESGSFFIAAPSVKDTPNFAVCSSGTLPKYVVTPDIPAPASRSLRVRASIAEEFIKLAVNGKEQNSSAVNQGTGLYGDHSLYIGRRGGTNTPFNGKIYYLMGTSNNLNNNDVALLEKELNLYVKINDAFIRKLITSGNRGFYFNLQDPDGYDETTGTIKDLSPLGYNAVQTASAQRAALVADEQARSLLFDGIDDFFRLPSINFQSVSAFTVICAVKKLNQEAQYECLVSSFISSARGHFAVMLSSDYTSSAFEFKGQSISYAVSEPYSVPKSQVITGIGNMGGNKTTLRLSGVETISTSPVMVNTLDTSGICIGARPSSFIQKANMQLYALFVVNKSLSSEDIAAIEKEFARYVDVTLPT